MQRSAKDSSPQPPTDVVLRDMLGYLNFSGGKPDPAFQTHVDEMYSRLERPERRMRLRELLHAALSKLHAGSTAFADSTQAEFVLDLAFADLFEAYINYHADLLFHLDAEDLDQPLLIARMCEAVLAQGEPWSETERIVQGALFALNDFIGFRPVAVLENGRRMEPYPHEKFRPIPLYLRDVGVAEGPYHDVLDRALEILRHTPEEFLHEAYFDLELLDELALDCRAHDHSHPINKRTNYIFGEWDPHHIDLKGRYRRFVLRKIVLDALVEWISTASVPLEEAIYDAGAVLSGTILMASAISGNGPGTHDSSVSLTSLLPKVARQRDVFYTQVLQQTSGPRAKRLLKNAKETQQPFGHVRQFLNLYLSDYGARQLQHRHLAHLYARMGYPAEGRLQAAVIPAASIRFECEIQCRLTEARLAISRANHGEAADQLQAAESLLHRGIQCGAIVDPWNILGFQGLVPLFNSREDAVPDQRVPLLVHLVEQLFLGYCEAAAEAAASGEEAIVRVFEQRLHGLADWWDRFGSSAIIDLPEVEGQEHWDAARHVAAALGEWHKAGASTGDISFWREKVEHFDTARAYAQVAEMLLRKRDESASMGLLIQWLDRAEDVGWGAGRLSFSRLLLDWFEHVCGELESGHKTPAETYSLIRKMIDYIEANAGEFWHIPSEQDLLSQLEMFDDFTDVEEGIDGEMFADEEEEDEENSLFQAAYEGVIFRDSAEDGRESELFDDLDGDDEFAAELQEIDQHLTPRLRFFRLMSQVWQLIATAVITVDARANEAGSTADAESKKMRPTLERWQKQAAHWRRELNNLVDVVERQELIPPSGDQDSNVEYDNQSQIKAEVVRSLLMTMVALQTAETCLAAAGDLPTKPLRDKITHQTLRAIAAGDAAAVRRLLPRLFHWLKSKPLLYIPVDSGGEAEQLLKAKNVQSLLMLLVAELPRIGLLRETWHLLKLARHMERKHRPNGIPVSEFDRLFRTALQETLRMVVAGSAKWRSGKFTDAELIDTVAEIVEHYHELWDEHSRTMRLSTVELLKFEDRWIEVKDFITTYGAELFAPRNLELGHLRTVLRIGVDGYLDVLEETADPLQPSKLVEDLRTKAVDRDDVIDVLELIFSVIVDRFKRWVEFNSTTTHSDYGEKLYCLFDFLRLEVDYERDAWNLVPVAAAHEVLTRSGKIEAASIWEDVLEQKTAARADEHLERLHQMEQLHGMRMRSISDHMQERFVKPLAVNRMLGLIPAAMSDAVERKVDSEAFQKLRTEVETYLEGSAGSGLEVPIWLRSLEDEIDEVDFQLDELRPDLDPALRLPLKTLNLREIRRQLRHWEEPIAPPTDVS